MSIGPASPMESGPAINHCVDVSTKRWLLYTIKYAFNCKLLALYNEMCVIWSQSYYVFLTDVECVNLQNPANGMVTTTGIDFGSKARYRCNRGHLLVGGQTRVCEANGHWSGQDPECRCTYICALYLINAVMLRASCLMLKINIYIEDCEGWCLVVRLS